MAIRRAVRSLVAGAAAVLALGATACTGYPAAPSDPAFDTDVRPIFLAHCARCHGNGPDGGALNNALFGDTGQTMKATGPCLTQYGGNPGSGCPAGAASVKATVKGMALTYPPEIVEYVHSTDPTEEMPPPPAPRLNSYELDVIDRWNAEGSTPKCSNSSHPDPALFCPDGGT
jgi:hypothetical protein